MTKKIVTLIVSIILVSILAFSNAASAKDAAIRIGDFWEYAISAEVENITIQGSMKISVESRTTQTIGGTSTSILVCKVIGNGTFSMTGMFDNGEFEINGIEKHVESNFSTLFNSYVFDMEVGSGGLILQIGMGLITENTPPIDVYVGNDNLTVGSAVDSSSLASYSGWIDMPIVGNSSLPSSDMNVNVEMRVLAENVPVTVPAGTFDCYKIKVTENNGMPYHVYYSEKVGNYVKIEGSESSQFLGGDMQLKSYLYAASSDALITMIIIGGGLSALIIAIVATTLILRRRGGGRMPATRAMEPLQPQHQATPPPAPPMGPPMPPVIPGKSP
ncbi:MAG: hypothetical protein OEV21_00305 [Thermoplasmata archaeon]|nr:hypothetical protein [Thermoplasmata archaeon]